MHDITNFNIIITILPLVKPSLEFSFLRSLPSSIGITLSAASFSLPPSKASIFISMLSLLPTHWSFILLPQQAYSSWTIRLRFAIAIKRATFWVQYWFWCWLFFCVNLATIYVFSYVLHTTLYTQSTLSLGFPVMPGPHWT